MQIFFSVQPGERLLIDGRVVAEVLPDDMMGPASYGQPMQYTETVIRGTGEWVIRLEKCEPPPAPPKPEPGEALKAKLLALEADLRAIDPVKRENRRGRRAPRRRRGGRLVARRR